MRKSDAAAGDPSPAAVRPAVERVAGVERALAASALPVTAAQLAKHSLRAKPAGLAEILETLVTLGRASPDGDLFNIS